MIRYGLLPDELVYVSRMYFARTPGSEVWVVDGHLPEITREALWPRDPQDDTDEVPF